MAKNHKERFYEFDIIAKSPSGVLVFIEVKTKNDDATARVNSFFPEDNLTRFKIKKLVKGINIFIARHPSLIDEDRGWRIDLIAVTIINRAKIVIRHYENI